MPAKRPISREPDAVLDPARERASQAAGTGRRRPPAARSGTGAGSGRGRRRGHLGGSGAGPRAGGERAHAGDARGVGLRRVRAGRHAAPRPARRVRESRVCVGRARPGSSPAFRPGRDAGGGSGGLPPAWCAAGCRSTLGRRAPAARAVPRTRRGAQPRRWPRFPARTAHPSGVCAGATRGSPRAPGASTQLLRWSFQATMLGRCGSTATCARTSSAISRPWRQSTILLIFGG